jgi:hypothetical protein
MSALPPIATELLHYGKRRCGPSGCDDDASTITPAERGATSSASLVTSIRLLALPQMFAI